VVRAPNEKLRKKIPAKGVAGSARRFVIPNEEQKKIRKTSRASNAMWDQSPALKQGGGERKPFQKGKNRRIHGSKIGETGMGFPPGAQREVLGKRIDFGRSPSG